MTERLRRDLRRREFFGPKGPANEVSRIINSYGLEEGERIPCYRSIRRVCRSIYMVKHEVYSKCSSRSVIKMRHELMRELNKGIRNVIRSVRH
jgi:hypothetical protein